jgi:nucleotide-binding universal stress UspA family protein
VTRIVVGIDGSEHAARALRRAVTEAQLRSAELLVVHVCPAPHPLADPVLSPPPPREQRLAAGRQVLDTALAEVDTTGVEVEARAAIGNVARVLCEAAQGAQLLVVGARGLGGFRGLLVGSVTQQVVAHAPCSVLVVVPEGR